MHLFRWSAISLYAVQLGQRRVSVVLEILTIFHCVAQTPINCLASQIPNIAGPPFKPFLLIWLSKKSWTKAYTRVCSATRPSNSPWYDPAKSVQSYNPPFTTLCCALHKNSHLALQSPTSTLLLYKPSATSITIQCLMPSAANYISVPSPAHLTISFFSIPCEKHTKGLHYWGLLWFLFPSSQQCNQPVLSAFNRCIMVTCVRR